MSRFYPVSFQTDREKTIHPMLIKKNREHALNILDGEQKKICKKTHDNMLKKFIKKSLRKKLFH